MLHSPNPAAYPAMEFRFRAVDRRPRRFSSPPSRPRDGRFTPRVGPGHFHGGPPPPPPQVEWEAAAARREQIIREEVERRIIEEEVVRRLVARARLHGGFGPEPFLRPDGPFVRPPPGPFLGVDVPVPLTMPPPMPVGMHPDGPAPASFGPRRCSGFGQTKLVVKERRPLLPPKRKLKPLKDEPNKSSQVLSSETKLSNAKSKVDAVTGTTAEPSVSGLKRKADVTAVATEPTKLQKAAQDWICALCQVHTTGEASLNTHLEGKKHKAKLAQYGVVKATGDYENDFQATTGNKDSGCPTNAARKISILVDGVMHEVVQKSNHLWCERCRVRCESNMSMADHLQGKKHSELNKVWRSIKAVRLNKSKEGSAATCRIRVNENGPIITSEEVSKEVPSLANEVNENGPVEIHEEVKKETADMSEEVNENSLTEIPVEITGITSEVNTNNHIEIPVQTKHEDTDMEGN